MNPFHQIFNNMNNGPQMRVHGSVEDMIRGVLGNAFAETVPQTDNTEKISEIPDYAENDKIETIEPPKPKEKPKKIEKYCDSCDRPESKCICDEEFDEVDYGGDSEVEDEDDFIEPEEELSPFEEVVKKLKSSKPANTKPEYQNTQGIGLKPKEKIPAKPISKHYPFYRDIDEVFECNVTIEGTMSTATVRLILNTDTWNLVFYGRIKKDGTCLIPIKKLSILPGGTTGRATLEVVVDDVVFYPWENAFRVEESRKVQVQIKGKSSK